MEKLLITLGDSWTEGVGIYEDHILEKYGNPPIFNGSDINHQQDMLHVRRYFQENCWSTKLAKKINYNIVNLGKGGAANSAAAKYFYDYVNTHNLDSYDKILVIFLISEPIRFSFYSSYPNITSILPHVNENQYYKASADFKIFLKYFLTNLQSNNIDSWKETKFYIQTISALCKIRNFNFFYGSAFTPLSNEIDSNDSTFLGYAFKNKCFSSELQYPAEYAKCGHPNEIGYSKMCELMYSELLSKNYEF